MQVYQAYVKYLTDVCLQQFDVALDLQMLILGCDEQCVACLYVHCLALVGGHRAFAL